MIRTLSALCLVGSVFASAPPACAQAPAAGERPSYAFRTPPLEGRGIASLADLRGKPVLIDFWGTR